MKVGHHDVRYSTVEPEAIALELHEPGCQCSSQSRFTDRQCPRLYISWKEAALYECICFCCGELPVTVDSENTRRKSILRWAFQWVSVAWNTCLSLCFLLCPSLSHLALWVLTPRVSGALLLVCLCTYFSFKAYCQLSNPSLCLCLLLSFFLFFFTFNLVLLPSDCLSLEACARYCCVWWWTHVTVPCHTKHSPMPLNDTWRHPTVHIAIVARRSAGCISGKKSHFGSAPSAGYSGGDISDCGWDCSGSLYIPRSVAIIDFHSVCCERQREGERRLGSLGDQLVILAM